MASGTRLEFGYVVREGKRSFRLARGCVCTRGLCGNSVTLCSSGEWYRPTGLEKNVSHLLMGVGVGI